MNSQKKYNVWIIEDDMLFRESLSELVPLGENLELHLVTDSVEKALERVEEFPYPDVILQDVGLPGLSGIEAIPIFKEKFATVKIVILTIFDDDARVFEAIQQGADGYLLKRTPGREILQGIQAMLEGGAPISPEIAKKMLTMLSGEKVSVKKETNLTNRERTILEYLVEGLTIDMISAELKISPFTVDTHTKNIYRKLQVHSRGQVVSKAIREGLI